MAVELALPETGVLASVLCALPAPWQRLGFIQAPRVDRAGAPRNSTFPHHGRKACIISKEVAHGGAACYPTARRSCSRCNTRARASQSTNRGLVHENLRLRFFRAHAVPASPMTAQFYSDLSIDASIARTGATARGVRAAMAFLGVEASARRSTPRMPSTPG